MSASRADAAAPAPTDAAPKTTESPKTGAPAPVTLMMRADLAAGRLTMAEYAREAREAGVPAADVAATLKQHAAAKEAQFMEGDATGASSPPAAPVDTVLPPGTYYGRTHDVAVQIVDGIYVPVDAPTAPAAAAPVEASLAWLRARGAWGPRAVERLGPANDFLPDLDLYDESRGGRSPADCLGAEDAKHLACALAANCVLTSLNLGNNAIGEEGAAHFARALESNTTLTELNLADNSLGDAGARHVAAALLQNATLREVDARGNGIGDAAAAELRAAWGSQRVRLQIDG